MYDRVLGVGVGLFILILVWSVALAGLLLLSRIDVGSAIVILSLATTVTVLLLLVPREQKDVKGKEEDKPEVVLTDSMFVWRTVMVVIMSISGLVGAAVVGVDYGLHSVKPAQIKKTI